VASCLGPRHAVLWSSRVGESKSIIVPISGTTLGGLNGSSTFAATTGTVTYGNDAATACPASPTSLHVLP
jgi:uncharacterized spore protein YtfJ